MTKYIPTLYLLIFFCRFGFAETYTWEDYDDFSVSSLDTKKWGVSCWEGGNLPIISNGRVLLAGKTNSTWNQAVATSRMLGINPNAASILAGGGEAHSVLEFKESDDIYGIELSLTLPSNVPPDSGIGLYAIDYAEMFSGNEPSSVRFDLDLWHGSGSPEVQISWKNPSTGAEEKAKKIPTSKDLPVTLAFIRDESNIEFFINNQVVKKTSYQSVGETFLVRTVSEKGNPIQSYLDNVRVLRRSQKIHDYTPASIGGKSLVYSEKDSTEITRFDSDGKVYGDKEGEWTYYTYQKVSEYVAKIIYTFQNLQNPQPEEEILTFSSASGGTFEWSKFSDSTMSNKIESSNGNFTLSSTVLSKPEPITLINDPSGLPIVVQVGSEYNWNSTLDGITLWSVEHSSDGWSSMTMRFENGRNFGKQGLYNAVVLPQSYDKPFVIDENGYLKVTENSGYQYYNIVSIENGVFGTIQNDQGVGSVVDNGVNQVNQWFFTTRASAEDYYYSKVGNPNPKGWKWFKHYPWVYSDQEKGWLYYKPSGDKLLYFSHNDQVWLEFSE